MHQSWTQKKTEENIFFILLFYVVVYEWEKVYILSRNEIDRLIQEPTHTQTPPLIYKWNTAHRFWV